MELCSKDETVNMNTPCESYAPYFYIHLSIIYELRILIPFTSFKTEFLTAANIALSQVTSNV